MTIIEIKALDNGAHRNQTHHGVVPDGWAIIPEDMAIPDTFPFVGIEVEDSWEYGAPVVISMTAGVMPEPEEPVVPEPVPEPDGVTWAAMAAAISEGVNEV